MHLKGLGKVTQLERDSVRTPTLPLSENVENWLNLCLSYSMHNQLMLKLLTLILLRAW